MALVLFIDFNERIDEMKVLKIILITIGCIIGAFIIIFGIYLLLNIQGKVESSELGSPDAQHRILIASQGSNFKKALVESLTSHLGDEPIYIKIVDVSALADVDQQQWDAVVIICTFEKWKVQSDVGAYLERTKELDKIILIVTSGSGEGKPKEYDIDALTSASRKSEYLSLIPNVLNRLNAILAGKEME